MATKRSAPEDNKPSRPSFGHGSGGDASKRRKPNTFPSSAALRHATTAGRPFKKAHPVNELKSQIRSLRRLLSRGDDAPLPANVRVEKERALRTAEHDLAATQRAQRRSAMIGKWHKVRFFERQKAGKRLKKARKAFAAAETEDEKRELEDAVGEVEVEVNYAVYYPLEKEYVPLFYTKAKRKKEEEGEGEGEGKANEGGDGEEGRKGDPEMWELIKKCMADGTLKDLREGKLERGQKEGDEHEEVMRRGRHGVGKPAKRKSKDEEDNVQDTNDSDNESDGGFFE